MYKNRAMFNVGAFVYFPAAQTVHAVEPVVKAVFPMVQAEHLLIPVFEVSTAIASVNSVPTGHATQTVRAVFAQYDPASHVTVTPVVPCGPHETWFCPAVKLNKVVNINKPWKK
jgi:hypothetical protein